MAAKPTFTQVTPHIHKLDLPFLGGKQPVGVWMVRDEAGGWVMVDAGAPGFEKLIFEQVLALTQGERPKLLVLTHGHLDHAGAAQKVREDWKIPIAAHRLEIPYLVGPTRYTKIPAKHLLYQFAQTFSPPLLVGRNVQMPLDEGRLLDGGLEVFHTPGHAPGMITLLHAADRALIAADTFMNLNNKLSDPHKGFTYDPGLNHASQARMVQLDFDHLLPSHGAFILNTGREQARALVESRAKKPRRAAKPAASAA
jgi:glyoxylase-like metal-dependent hydrolase (beta-lactamase superfamily II)